MPRYARRRRKLFDDLGNLAEQVVILDAGSSGTRIHVFNFVWESGGGGGAEAVSAGPAARPSWTGRRLQRSGSRFARACRPGRT